jgi:cytoskeletal protein RodZ
VVRKGERLLIMAGWLVAVVLAVLVGVVGIRLVGSGLTDRQATPLAEDDVVRELRALASAGTSPSPSGPGTPSPSASDPTAPSASAAPPISPSTAPSSTAPASAAPPAGRSFTTQGGLVVADCTRIISMAPAQGWSVVDQDDDEGEFRSVDDPTVGLEIDLECENGQPQIRVAPAD